MKLAGQKIIDGEALSWELADIDDNKVVEYMNKHQSEQIHMVPIELVLEIVDKAEEIE